jgi:hypothetical protein
MNSKDYLKDISEIKNLMNKSSKFISLSGLSGIFAGIYALIGAGYAYWLVNKNESGYLNLDDETFCLILIDLFLVGIVSIGTAIILTTKKAKQNDEKIWDPLTRRLLLNFIIPLAAGGIYILIILSQQRYEQTGDLMLLFYGLALFNASKYTLGDVKYLGLTQITLGLLSAIFPGYGFWFWVIGFGVMHILYGLVMYFKYDRN